MDQKKIDRINELYHKKQEGTLAEEEREEQEEREADGGGCSFRIMRNCVL